jgi:type II secretory pathway component PulC
MRYIMDFTEILTSIKPYFRQSEGHLWLLAIIILAIMVVSTIVYSLYDGVKVIVFNRAVNEMVVEPVDVSAASTMNQLSQYPLFGTSEAAATQRINTTLLLLGVLFSKDQKQAEAIIASQGQEPKVYRVNDEIADGGRLQSIYPDRVLLQREGRLETLYLDWTKRAPKSQAPKVSRSPSTTEDKNDDNAPSTEANEEQAPARAAPIPAPIPAPGPTSTVPTSEQTDQWRERIKAMQEKYQQQYGSTGGRPGVQTIDPNSREGRPPYNPGNKPFSPWPGGI